MNGLFFRTLRPDGTVDTSPFIVPPGQVLVVTSAQWEVTGATPDSLQRINVTRNNTTAIHMPTIANANGIDTGSMTFPPGFVLGPDVQPCALISGSTADLIVYLQGYLAVDD